MKHPGERRLHLLVSLCRRDADSRLAPADLAALAGDAEWGAFLQTASTHHLEGLALATLERLEGRSPRGPRVTSEGRMEALRLLRRRTVGWDLEQARVLAWLEKHGTSPVVLKGCALRHSVYSEPAERPVADLDLLFPRDSLGAARDALAALGYVDPNPASVNELYVQHHFHTQLRHPGGFAIELHWGLTPPGPGPYIDPDVVREGARPVSGSGRPFLAPRPEHMVLHLASQSIEGSLERLGRLVDVDRVIAGAGASFDWELLRSEAARGRLQNAVGVMLRVAERLFDTPVPPGFVERLGIPRLTRWNLAALSPVRWTQDRRVSRYAAARVVMRFWLEATPQARTDVLLKAYGLRTDPMKLLHDAVADGEEPADARLWHWVPAFLKIGAYQVVVWARAAAGVFSGRWREPFW